MYAIHTTVETTVYDSHGNQWSGGYELPTFYFDPDVQGIESEDHAVDVALRMMRQLTEGRDDIRSIHVKAVDLNTKEATLWVRPPHTRSPSTPGK